MKESVGYVLLEIVVDTDKSTSQLSSASAYRQLSSAEARVEIVVDTDKSTSQLSSAEARASAYRQGHLVAEHAIPLDPRLLDVRDDCADVAVRSVDALVAIDRADPRRVALAESVVRTGWRGHPPTSGGPITRQHLDEVCAELERLVQAVPDEYLHEIAGALGHRTRRLLEQLRQADARTQSDRSAQPAPPALTPPDQMELVRRAIAPMSDESIRSALDSIRGNTDTGDE
jgi:hypothetical protein